MRCGCAERSWRLRVRRGTDTLLVIGVRFLDGLLGVIQVVLAGRGRNVRSPERLLLGDKPSECIGVVDHDVVGRRSTFAFSLLSLGRDFGGSAAIAARSSSNWVSTAWAAVVAASSLASPERLPRRPACPPSSMLRRPWRGRT